MLRLVMGKAPDCMALFGSRGEPCPTRMVMGLLASDLRWRESVGGLVSEKWKMSGESLSLMEMTGDLANSIGVSTTDLVGRLRFVSLWHARRSDAHRNP